MKVIEIPSRALPKNRSQNPHSPTRPFPAPPNPPEAPAVAGEFPSEDQHPTGRRALHGGVVCSGAGRGAAGVQLGPAVGLSALGPVCILPLTSWNPCHAGFLLPVFVADLHSKAFRIFQSKSRREASVLTDPCLKMGSQGGHLKHWHGLPWAHPVKS